MKRRLLSLSLALALCLAFLPTLAHAENPRSTPQIKLGDYVQMGSYKEQPILPTSVLAAGTAVTTEADLRAAVAVENFAVTLDGDITLTSDLEITVSGTIDGGGHTLSGGTVTLPDSDTAPVELAISNLTITNANGRGVYIGWSGMEEDKFRVTIPCYLFVFHSPILSPPLLFSLAMSKTQKEQ